ncbi:sphingosine N-acyltransferase lac1 [Trichoderma parareesei]|uniref:Sphingosine N-acyltransferase lac1 n=1 Tax=Trichoderma parareesei TaxID=858221 RepID=A0A2H2ZIW3_TRIPA|nr:sphingosine N-acyltransferase lac1 [Trichoderma parareesei]
MGDSHGLASEKTATGSSMAPQSSSRPANGVPNGSLYLQASGSNGNVVLVRRLRRKDEGLWKPLARWFVENQVGLSLNLLALLFLSHACIPKAREYTTKFFHLSYYNGKTGKYATGFDDAYLIAFFIVLFTGLRAGTMEYILAPLGRLNGISKRKDVTRFSEQAWLLVYYAVFWPTGVYLYYNSPAYLNLRELWTDWPNREMGGLMKWYMLAQWAFWLQQIVVINIEDRRKDHWQMFSHHLITTALISSCYCYHHTRVGMFILVIMDVVDLFLPLAKCLKYCGFSTLCDVTFGLFMVTWFIARHVFYLAVCWSIYAHTPEIMPNGCFAGPNSSLQGPFEAPSGFTYLIEPFFNSTGRVCYNETVKWAFLTPLLLLQGITIFWFCMIVRVAIKVLRGDGAEDTRSDDEGEEGEDEEELIYEEVQPLEQEVGVEELDLKSWERRNGLKKQVSASGVSLPGHSDRKELLGRIGCEKQVE